jgi:hypothetical protein
VDEERGKAADAEVRRISPEGHAYGHHAWGEATEVEVEVVIHQKLILTNYFMRCGIWSESSAPP